MVTNMPWHYRNATLSLSFGWQWGDGHGLVPFAWHDQRHRPRIGARLRSFLGQGPSPEQIAEIRRECRADYIRHCSDVPPSGQPAFACPRRNDAQLSNGCRLAVEAVGAHASGSIPPLGATSAPASASGDQPLMEAYAADFDKYCPGVVAGGGRALGCLLDRHASRRSRRATCRCRKADAERRMDAFLRRALSRDQAKRPDRNPRYRTADAGIQPSSAKRLPSRRASAPPIRRPSTRACAGVPRFPLAS
jgi:hypothetical protein